MNARTNLKNLKFVMVTAFFALTALPAHAAQSVVSCHATSLSAARFGMELDDSGFDVGSGLADIVRTNWAFQYSSARLVCSNHVLNVSGGTLERIACIGYLEGTGARVELAGHLTNGVGTLVFHNIDRNVYSRASEGLRLVCALQNYP